jgi:multiple antibiotic resistance protein
VDGLGLSTSELLGLLILGMGPTRVALAFLRIAPTLDRAQQREVAARTALTGIAVSVLLVVAGGGIVRSYSPRVETVLIGSGIVLVAVTVAGLLPTQPPPAGQPPPDYRSFAISPLGVPAMINPVGVTLLFAQAGYATGVADRLIFLGLVVGVLLVNYVTLLLVPLMARAFAVPVLRVLQEIFSLLTVALGVRMILLGLDGFGVIDIDLR